MNDCHSDLSPVNNSNSDSDSIASNKHDDAFADIYLKVGKFSWSVLLLPINLAMSLLIFI